MNNIYENWTSTQLALCIEWTSYEANLEKAPEEVWVWEEQEGEGEVRREAAVEHGRAHVHQGLKWNPWWNTFAPISLILPAYGLQ